MNNIKNMKMTNPIDNLTQELFSIIGLTKDNYFTIITQKEAELIANYINLANGIGFDEGISFERSKHANNMQRPVRMTDAPYKQFDSCSDAARYVKRTKSALISALNKNQRCGGIKWEYV